MEPMTLMALGTAGGNAMGGAVGSITQYLAMKKQLEANKQAQGAITGAYEKGQGYQQPYLKAGQVGLDRMMQGNYDVNVPQYQAGNMPGPYQEKAFNYQEDPGMAYRMQTGQQAVQSGAAAQGGGLSGATMKALARFGSNLGSQEYGNAYNRYAQDQQRGLAGYQTNLGRAQDIRDTGWGAQRDIYTMASDQANRRYGRAQDLGSMGQTAAGNLSQMATDYGGNLAGLYGARGNIQSAGTMGMGQNIGQSLGGMMNTGLDWYGQNQNQGKNNSLNNDYNRIMNTPYSKPQFGLPSTGLR